MIKVLVNSYACSPNMGSEPGLGWNWVMHLARHCELFIITEGEFRDKIEQTVPLLEQKRNMHFYYLPLEDRIRKMCWNQGDWRFYYYYKKWQKRAANLVRDICKQEKIDILHQLNMIGFREPGYLWQVSQETGIPFVWGPVDAKESFPLAYTQGESWKTRAFYWTKNLITKWQLKHSYRVHEAVYTASLVLAASSNSVKSFRKYYSLESILMNETGTSLSNDDVGISHNQGTTFDILWVGKMDFRKQLGLAIRSVALTNQHQIRLHIVGDGNAVPYKHEAEKLGIAEQCYFHGSISHQDVQQLMQESDLLFFTSVAEGTPHVVLEAIRNHLPILCFDTCGQGDCVTDSIGIKIPLTNPTQSVKDFSEQILFYFHHKDVLAQLSVNCQKRAEALSWEHKAKQMVALYYNVLSK